MTVALVIAALAVTPPPECGWSLVLGKADGKDVVRVTAEDAARYGVEAEGRLIPRESGEWGYEFSYRARPSEWRVETVSFPELTVGADDASRIFYSFYGSGAQGAVLRPKWEKAKPGAEVLRAKPVGFQCTAFFGPKENWYFDSRDTEWNNRTFVFSKGVQPGTAVLALETAVPLTDVARRTWTLPFSGLIRTFDGSWFAACEIYRAWAHGQDWYRTAVARDFGKLGDVSMWFWNRGRSSVVLPSVEAFADETGVPVALDWYWWHEIPYDTSFPRFWPPREGEASFRAAVRRLRGRGVYVQTYTNAMTWDADDRLFGELGGADEVVLHRDGTRDGSVYNPFVGHFLAHVCGEAPRYQGYFKGLVKTLRDTGLDGVYMDQIACCANRTCWNAKHAHPLNGGGAMTRGYRRYLAELRAANPGLQLSSEDCGEAFLDRFDSMISLFSCYERLNKGTSPDFEMVPAFMAIYHGAVALFGSYASIDGVPPWDEKWPEPKTRAPERDWNALFPDQFALELGRNVVWGVQPCVHQVLDHHRTNAATRANWDFMKETARFWHANREFLFGGEMLDPGSVACAGKDVDFLLRGIYNAPSGKYGVRTEKDHPSVLSGCWRAKDGRRALVLFNWTREPRPYVWQGHGKRFTGELPPRSYRIEPLL